MGTKNCLNEVAVRTVALVVFLMPVVISLFFGTMVMAEVLKEPDRELNMWRFDFSKIYETKHD